MKKLILLAVLALSIITSFAQNSNRNFVGVWKLAAVKSIAADSTITYPYGQQPKGIMLLDASKNYAIEIYKTDRAKIVSGNKSTATAEENSMLVKGCNAHYGTYEADIKNNVIVFKVQHAFFPNWEGTNLNQSFTFIGDTVTFTSSTSTFGASKAVVVWVKSTN